MTKLMTLLICLLAGNLSFAADDSADPKNVEIKDAYEDSSGRLMVRFKDKYGDSSNQNPEFFGGNLTFYGTEKGLYQLEGSDKGGTKDSYQYQFSDSRLPKKENQAVGDFYSGLDKSGNVASEYSVVCGDESKSIDYKPLSKKRLANLEDTIRHGRTKLNSLPQDARTPVYIFKKDDGTMIYVDAFKYDPPRYSSRVYSGFRVFVGKPGQMKEKKVQDVQRVGADGTIRFTIETGEKLFSPTGQFQRPDGTIGTRIHEGKIEDVQRKKDGSPRYVTTKTGEKLLSPTPMSTKSPTWNGVDIKEVDSRKFDFASLGIKGVPSSDSGAAHTPCDKFFGPKNTTSSTQVQKANDPDKGGGFH